MIETVLLSVVISLIVAFLVWSDRSENGGAYFWQRSWLFANGAQASGIVLDHAEHSPSMARRTPVHLVDLVVEFTPEGGAPMRVPLRYRLADGAMSRRVEKGETLPLRYDPRRPTFVLLDEPKLWGTGAQPGKEPDREQREQDRKRQEALLRGEKK